MKAGVPKSRAEVKDLEQLRQLFLDAPERSGVSDYWSDNSLLELYDSTFARRILWKWEAVVRELALKNWVPPPNASRWVDWGCGSGVASEAFLLGFETSEPHEIILSDRSLHARQFSEKKVRHLRPQARIVPLSPEQLQIQETDLVLISHVLTELNDDQFQTLSENIESAAAIVWIEPGTPFCSRRLISLRQRLLSKFEVIAPCPHQGNCGLQEEGRDWCHFFAPAPSEVFQSSEWMNFSKEMKIDLRSLPVSFLVLQRKSALEPSITPKLVKRALGRPRFYKGHAKLLICSNEGVNEASLQERNHKSSFKSWQRDSFVVEITNAQDCD